MGWRGLTQGLRRLCRRQMDQRSTVAIMLYSPLSKDKNRYYRICLWAISAFRFMKNKKWPRRRLWSGIARWKNILADNLFGSIDQNTGYFRCMATTTWLWTWVVHYWGYYCSFSLNPHIICIMQTIIPRKFLCKIHKLSFYIIDNTILQWYNAENKQIITNRWCGDNSNDASWRVRACGLDKERNKLSMDPLRVQSNVSKALGKLTEYSATCGIRQLPGTMSGNPAKGTIFVSVNSRWHRG